MPYLIAVLLIIIAGVEMPYLLKHRLWGHAIVVAVLLLVSLFYDIALIKEWQAPNLKQAMEAIFGPVTDCLEGFFNCNQQ